MICSTVGMVYSGMGPDFRVLVSKARKAAQQYKRVYMEEPPTRILVQEIASVMQEYTQSGQVQQKTLVINMFMTWKLTRLVRI